MTVSFAPIDLQLKVTQATARAFDAALRQLRSDMLRRVMQEMEGPDRITGVIAAKGIEVALRPTKYWKNRVHFSADVTRGMVRNIPSFSIRFTVGGPGAKFYRYVEDGTRWHLIKPKRAKALIIRGYIPRTRPIYTERRGQLLQAWPQSSFVGSPRKTRTVQPHEALRGYKGKFYPRAWLRGKGIKNRHFVFAKRATQSIAPRRFSALLAVVLEHTLAAELKRLGHDLGDYLGKQVDITARFVGP